MESNNQCFDHSDSIFQINNKNVKRSPFVPVSSPLLCDNFYYSFDI